MSDSKRPTIDKIVKRDARILRMAAARLAEHANLAAGALEREEWGMAIVFLQDLEQAAATFVVAIPQIEQGYKAVARDPDGAEARLSQVEIEDIDLPPNPTDPKVN